MPIHVPIADAQVVFDQLNAFGKTRTPIVFGIDFWKKKGFVFPYSQRFIYDVAFRFGNLRHENPSFLAPYPLDWEVDYFPYEEYKKGFARVHAALARGDSYLTNYTCRNRIFTQARLAHIYERAQSRYAFRMGEDWLCYSPETFVRVYDDTIFAYPMKGTLSAEIPNARECLLNDQKEKAEHNTIVDLIRNDLSQIAQKVEVTRFRYLDTIHTQNGKILQASSEIKGSLPHNWNENLGEWLEKLLPAGSVSGAPKRETLEIIAQSETYSRGFYTGIIGFFDGFTLDTAVAIRFIENMEDGLFYKTGGGITHLSKVADEYNEMKQKIYVPLS